MMRRDRFFLVVTLTAIFSADLYFVLLPKLHSVGQRSARPCSCGDDNVTLPGLGGLATPQLSNWTSAQRPDGSRSEAVEMGSKLDSLFSHPLYSIQTPELAPEERLLGTSQLMEYYKKKVARWERLVRDAFTFQSTLSLFLQQLACNRLWGLFFFLLLFFLLLNFILKEFGRKICLKTRVTARLW